jgi:hypothetical protein
LFQRVCQEIFGIRDRAGPLRDHFFEKGALAKRILKRFSWNGIGI